MARRVDSGRRRARSPITLSDLAGPRPAAVTADLLGSGDLGLQPLRRAERDVRCPPGMAVGNTRPYCIWG